MSTQPGQSETVFWAVHRAYSQRVKVVVYRKQFAPLAGHVIEITDEHFVVEDRGDGVIVGWDEPKHVVFA